MRTVRIALLACWVLGGCDGADENERALEACLPEPYRDTCVADVTLDIYRSCFDGSGRCTWSESRAGGDYQLSVEWENGARFESVDSGDGSSTTIEAASGERCTLTPVDTADCDGYRYASGERWYEFCLVRDEDGTGVSSFRYTCDDGGEATIPADELLGSDLMCPMQIASPTDDCVDAEGRRLGDQSTTPDSEPPCSGDSCGDIGARCTDEMRCDQGLSCQSAHVDPAVLYGFCTGACDDVTPCPAGTACTNVLQPASGEIRRQCMRSCRDQAECAPFGSLCSAGTGYCN